MMPWALGSGPTKFPKICHRSHGPAHLPPSFPLLPPFLAQNARLPPAVRPPFRTAHSVLPRLRARLSSKMYIILYRCIVLLFDAGHFCPCFYIADGGPRKCWPLSRGRAFQKRMRWALGGRFPTRLHHRSLGPRSPCFFPSVPASCYRLPPSRLLPCRPGRSARPIDSG